MAIQHLVSITWRDGTPAADVAEIERQLRELVFTLPGIESYALGGDLGLGPGNSGFGIVARFADADAFLAYRDHPRHQEINSTLVAPRVAAKSAVQFEIAGTTAASPPGHAAAELDDLGPAHWRAAVLSTVAARD